MASNVMSKLDAKNELKAIAFDLLTEREIMREIERVIASCPEIDFMPSLLTLNEIRREIERM